MKCPRCPDAVLSCERIRDGHAYGMKCPSCGGFWLERGQLPRIEEAVELCAFEWRRIPAEEMQQRPLPCPACPSHPVMEKVRNERDHRVVMDFCSGCGGTWLDGGEVEAIQKEQVFVALAKLVRGRG